MKHKIIHLTYRGQRQPQKMKCQVKTPTLLQFEIQTENRKPQKEITDLLRDDHANMSSP